MPYRDENKRRSYNKDRMQRARQGNTDAVQGNTTGNTSEGNTGQGNTIPIDTKIYTDAAGREYTKRRNLGGYVKDYNLRTTPFNYSLAEGITEVTHPDVIKAANELEPHKFSYLGSYYYWNAGTVQEQLRALPPASRIR